MDTEPIPTAMTAGTATRSDIEINESIQDCIRRCRQIVDPRAGAEEFAARLIAAGWPEPDAHKVLVGALCGLAKVTGIASIWPR